MNPTLKSFAGETDQRPQPKGKFIVIEGIDGSGKGTQMCLLAQWLYRKNKNFHILMTREPSLSEHGELVRRLLATSREMSAYAREFLRLFVADRADHIRRLIQPALRYGCIVLCDRYKHSTIAYQQAQGVPFDEIMLAHKDFLVPDLTIVLDADPRAALVRNLGDASRQYQEVFEREVAFTEKMRQNYLALPERLKGERIAIVNANRPVDEVFKAICAEVAKIL
ncbi:MAG: dTMP kinase [Candidatus Aenigmatarchaeota archaeon]